MADKFTIGPKLTVDGEKEFKQAIAAINKDMTVLGSEMKLVTAQFAKNKDSVEALTAKNEVYLKQIDEQKKKIGTIADALKNANKEYGEGSDKAKEWQIKLNNANAELVKLENNLEDGEKAIKELSQEMDQSSAKTNKWSDALKQTGNVLGKGFSVAAKGTIVAAKGAAVAIGAVTTAAVGMAAGVWEAGKSTGKWADDLITLSNQTGITQDTLQQFDYAARFVDVSVEDMTKGMTKVVREMGAASKSGDKFIEVADGMKVSMYDSNGQMKTSEQMFYDTVDALGAITDETQREIAAQEIFGKSYQDMMPLIKAGSESLKQYGEEARAMGLILSDDMVAKMGEFDDIMQKTDAQMEGLKKQLVVNFMPALQGVATGLSGVLTEIGGALKDGFQPEDIKTIGKTITTKLVEGIKTFSEYIPQIVQTLSSSLTEVVNLLVTLIPVLLPPLMDAAFQLMQGVLDALMANLDPIIKVVTELILKLADFIIENLPMLLDAAIQIVLAIALGIADALPELIPAIVQMIDAIITVIIDNLPLFIEAAIKIIVALGAGLIQALPQLLLQIPKIWLGIRDAFLNIDWPKLGSDIMAGIGRGFTAAIGDLIKSAKEVMGKVVDGIKNFLDINSPSKVMADEVGLNMGLGVAEGLNKSSKTINKSFAAAIPTSLDAQISPTGGSVKHIHSGTLRIEGINDKGQMISAVDLIMDQLRMERMLQGA